MATLAISTGAHKLTRSITGPPDISVDTLNRIITETLGESYKINTVYLREFLVQIIELIANITEEFNGIFGKNMTGRLYLWTQAIRKRPHQSMPFLRDSEQRHLPFLPKTISGYCHAEKKDWSIW
jgi:hypothetical protein